jgi:hypothetical protein
VIFLHVLDSKISLWSIDPWYVNLQCVCLWFGAILYCFEDWFVSFLFYKSCEYLYVKTKCEMCLKCVIILGLILSYNFHVIVEIKHFENCHGMKIIGLMFMWILWQSLSTFYHFCVLGTCYFFVKFHCFTMLFYLLLFQFLLCLMLLTLSFHVSFIHEHLILHLIFLVFVSCTLSFAKA